MFVSLVYCAESTVRWFVVREKHCWMAADSADKSKRTGRSIATLLMARIFLKRDLAASLNSYQAHVINPVQQT
jgi:predicted type IV restriction endonuclease